MRFIYWLLGLINWLNELFKRPQKRLMMAENVQDAADLKSGFGKAGCHIENVGELLQEFDLRFVSEDGKVIKLTGEQVLQLLAMLYGKFAETFLECEGKVIEIEFGDSTGANLAEQLVKFILSLAGELPQAPREEQPNAPEETQA